MTSRTEPGCASYPRVLHALAPGAAGGLESVVAMLSREWSRQGGAVALALTLDPGAAIPSVLQAVASDGVELFPQSVAGRAYLEERNRFAATMRSWAPDLVHTHGYRADLVAGWAARRLGLPRVTTVHGFTGGGWKNRLYERVQLRGLRGFDGVIAVSRSVRDRLAASRIPDRLLTRIPNAWAPGAAPLARAEARTILGLGPRIRVLGWVGRLSREKGADVLLTALAQISEPDIHIALVGEGRERARLTTLARDLGIADRVHWHGLVQDAHRIYSAFDVFVLSSRTEGTPIALFEAMAARVPIVATAVGGVPDVVRNEEGVLVPSENPTALAAALREVLADPAAAAARSGRAAARLAEAYATAPWVERHRDLYRRILTDRGAIA